MLKTQRLIISCLVLAAGLGIGFVFFKLFTFEVANIPPPLEVTVDSEEKQMEVVSLIKLQLEVEGVKSEGLSPYLLLDRFPSVVANDFDGAEAIIGKYEMENDTLIYKSGETVSDAAATDLSEAGFALFLKNYGRRTNLDITGSSPAEIVNQLTKREVKDREVTDTDSNNFIACTLDAKQCSDGSYVGRMGPNCEFAACPGEDHSTVKMTCTPDQKQAEVCTEIYQPVCAAVQIQCITTPCEPIPKTFGNSCEACSENSVMEYTEGVCSNF